MAIYHYSHKPVSRGKGQSAVAGAAYRSAEKLYDRSIDETFDYSRRGGVAHAEIVLPTEAVKRDIQWAYNRQALWNVAEEAERRKDSRIAREHEVALPHELTKEQQIALLRSFSKKIADRYNVAVDFALHRPHRSGDKRNFHAHIYATTREITPTGLGAKASIELGDKDRFKRGLESGRKEIKFMREVWEKLENEHLRVQGIEARVDCRTLKAQGIDRVPTTHLGPAVWGMERRGIETRVGVRVRELGRLEREGRELSRSILDLAADLAAARAARGREGPGRDPSRSTDVLDTARGAAARWKEQRAQHPPLSIEEQQRQGREAWRKLRQEREAAQAKAREYEQKKGLEQARDQERGAEKSKDRGHERDGPKIDFD
jgi:ATP-dependent exoDNAse (exonuclease V) alpha subunit